jgi:2,3-dimethylmalate lyase
MTQVYQQFKDVGSSAGSKVPLYDFGELSNLMGFEDVWAFEKKYVETDDK